MMESKLKQLRHEQCLSQEELASHSNVSIKTIQRIENGQSNGSAYSIKQLALALDVEPIRLQTIQNTIPSAENNEETIVKLMNFSALAVMLLPLSNVIIPLLILLKNKDKVLISRMGKKIVSVQILWTFFSILSMILFPLLILIVQK